jgi:hypothetical protein
MKTVLKNNTTEIILLDDLDVELFNQVYIYHKCIDACNDISRDIKEIQSKIKEW